MTTAEVLARFAVGIRSRPIDESVIDAAKLVIFDTLACAIAGTRVEPHAGHLLHAAMRTAGDGRSTIIGAQARVDAATAAAVNAESGGTLSAQESFYFSHSSNLHLATALAIGEEQELGGEDLLRAFLAGFEISAALHVSRAAPQPPLVPFEGYVPSSNEYMVIGATAAAAVALGLDVEQTAHALAIAAATAPSDGGNVAPLGEINYCDYTSKGRAAVYAAFFAEEGATSRLQAVDECLFPAGSAGTALQALGTRWAIEETSIKFYPGCRFISGPIDLFADIVREHSLTADDIEEVVVRVSALALSNPKVRRVALPDPQDAADVFNLVFNAPYHAALLAHGVQPGPRWYDPRERSRPDVAAFMSRVRVVQDEAMTGRLREEAAAHEYGRVAMSGGAGVLVRTSAGVYERECDYVRGDPVDDALRASYADVVAKAHGYLDEIVGAERVDDIAAVVENLQSCATLGALTRLMS